MKKRILSTVVAAVAAMALLAGCSTTGDSSKETKAADTTTAAAEATTEAAADTTEYTGTVYNAYIGFQTPDWSFRDAWNNASTGIDGSEGLDFSKVHKSTDGVWSDLPGDLTDVQIKGDGTYTVKAENLEFDSAAFDSQEYLNLIFVSTDVPYSTDITISDVKLKVNGADTALAAGGFVIPDDGDYIQINIQNIWVDEIKEIGYYSVPVTSLEITFTISGITE